MSNHWFELVTKRCNVVDELVPALQREFLDDFRQVFVEAVGDYTDGGLDFVVGGVFPRQSYSFKEL